MILRKPPDTGEVEIYVAEMEVLSEAGDLPVPVFGEPDYPEDVAALSFLDLRRETLHQYYPALDIRGCAMTDDGFREYQTPILTAQALRARAILVPSRIHPGQFYALPQSRSSSNSFMVAGLTAISKLRHVSR